MSSEEFLQAQQVPGFQTNQHEAIRSGLVVRNGLVGLVGHSGGWVLVSRCLGNFSLVNWVQLFIWSGFVRSLHV